MVISAGTIEQVLRESPAGAGSSSKQGSVETDSLMATLWVDSTAGDLSVTVYTLTYEGKEVELFSFPTISAGSTQLLLKKAGATMQRYLVRATYTGACSYEVYIRAMTGAGESSVRIVGATSFAVSQQTVPNTAVELIPASLEDRQGIIIKNWSTGTNMYIAESEAKATSAVGYPVAPRDNVALDISAGVSIWAIAETGTVDVRIGES